MVLTMGHLMRNAIANCGLSLAAFGSTIECPTVQAATGAWRVHGNRDDNTLECALSDKL